MRVQIRSVCSFLFCAASVACAKDRFDSLPSSRVDRGPSAAAEAPDDAEDVSGAFRFLSGAEWILDSKDNVLASTAVLSRREVDSLHGRLRIHTHREPSEASGAFAVDSAADYSVVAARVAPWTVEGRTAREDGTRSDFSEENRAGVIVSKEVIRDKDGRVVLTRITNATSVSECEFDNRMRSSRSNR